jgi:excisionase family DNA binding protein
MADSPARRLYTIPEVALLLGIGRSTAYELVWRGEIEAVTIGRRRMITAAVLERLLGERPPPPHEVKRDLEREIG